MISKSYITDNLKTLNAAYNNASGKQALYFSKLAILELCGWIELSVDDLIERHAIRHLRDASNRKFVTGDIIKRNSGFDYNTNFRHMMMRTIGIITLEKVEAAIGPAVIAPFSAQLSNLKAVRNQLAHTYVKGTGATLNIDAPSVTRARFGDLHGGLIAYEAQLRTL
jgi:hypothetical protein